VEGEWGYHLLLEGVILTKKDETPGAHGFLRQILSGGELLNAFHGGKEISTTPLR